MQLENMMLIDGWKKVVTKNGGKEYIEFHKMGFIISEEDIMEDEK